MKIIKSKLIVMFMLFAIGLLQACDEKPKAEQNHAAEAIIKKQQKPLEKAHEVEEVLQSNEAQRKAFMDETGQ